MQARSVWVVTILTLSLVGLVADCAAQEAGSTVIKQGVVNDDLYLAGGSVQLSADVEGDAALAGGTITITQKVAGDVLAAGGTLNIAADIGDDLRAAGGNVVISGNVADDAIASGGNVTLGPDNVVGGRAWLAGGTVAVSGHVLEGLRAAGDRISIAGQIDGDVELFANVITIEPSAIIKGKLNYTSPHEAQIAGGAQIQGEITHHDFEADSGLRGIGGGIGGTFLFYLSLGLCAVVLFFLLPGFSGSVGATISRTPFRALGLGLLMLIVAPVLVAMLLVSVIGAPLGLALLASYFVLLLLGLLLGFIQIGEWGFDVIGKSVAQSRWMRGLSILCAAGVVFLAGLVPVLGPVVFLLVLLAGFGALVLSLYQRYQQAPSASASASAAVGATV